MTKAQITVEVKGTFVEVDLPIRIVSEMNSRDHWRVVRKRSKEASFGAL